MFSDKIPRYLQR